MKPAYLFAFLILAASMAFTLFSFGGAVAHQVHVAQAMQRPGETVQVAGKIVKESVTYDNAKGELQFEVVDRKDNKTRMKVVYNEPKPENFDSAVDVQAIGQYRDGAFHAHNLLVKCSSKYQDTKK